jgi:hypothetical protein
MLGVQLDSSLLSNSGPPCIKPPGPRPHVQARTPEEGRPPSCARHRAAAAHWHGPAHRHGPGTPARAQHEVRAGPHRQLRLRRVHMRVQNVRVHARTHAHAHTHTHRHRDEDGPVLEAGYIVT